MAKGGLRPGAGRPLGAKNKVTIERAKNCEELLQRANKEGLTPLEIMLHTMRDLWTAGKKMEACRIARDAAPYCHPKLTSIEYSSTPPYWMRLEQMSIEELEAEAQAHEKALEALETTQRKQATKRRNAQ